MKRLKTVIEWTLIKPSESLPDFIKALQKERIVIVVRQSDKAIVNGFTYIEYQTKAVFNGSDTIGKEYSTKAILERIGVQKRVASNSKANVLQTATLKALEMELETPDNNPKMP